MIYRKNIPSIMMIGVAVLAVAVGIISIFPAISSLKYDGYDKKSFIDPDVYQAIFLTNDQIYFGRLKNISSDYLILSDVYYVKVNENGAGQLVKLGAGEPHSPKNEMIINQDQVLFWENLRSDSAVVKTIQGLR
ncbi:MAG: hypothetical protein A3G02_01350 [Candidatus Yanofskybacteria bacterium RIFCSPLOWO2_12_FULL_44_13b]|uniref:Uncharacterized protein n=1 Tax=Candidatus Yanofskybacteria bacterium RIFCSPLOWO2_02_FULL_44_18 TaxID=1802705 RepID=A0A1F8H0N0_9BACT|nr:MAG: hypothetical protein A3C01_01295 [Candidatus Yanofskybacteria bacterium RIFCSPHIGHO2_02_FULL_44_36b]OGN25626.1 MAG: hypothetical protein A3B12_00535 [Candidatus Yanofskybacteria bacterium RIFCSPLOWO2_01_FULL_44_88]OGN31081.1 MAG: hypothetical protein A3I96_02165 [Candidatus Yanofskybacteria bacterium RIFCSPLOWO2_02_FULL_44_18]OGN35247.1 MAG: hypothetical protein A3G02_01350 [Candidatus Yanofskybacteria bacterium RIFCSPLOWO2_12_FULL_44_13b]